jgi:hypothetical protein
VKESLTASEVEHVGVLHRVARLEQCGAMHLKSIEIGTRLDEGVKGRGAIVLARRGLVISERHPGLLLVFSCV